MSFHDRVLALTRKITLILVLSLVLAVAMANGGTAQSSVDWERELEILRAVPYLAFSETIVDEGDTGVVLYDRERAHDGYNLYCSKLSGQAFLMDMEGRVVHRWTYSSRGSSQPCHVVMLENGDLVVIKKFMELLRLNWRSEVVWEKRLEAHHDVTPAPDGSFYVVIREFRDHRGLKVRFAAIVHLTEDGEEISRWSSYEHLAEIRNVLNSRSFLDTVIDSISRSRGGKEVKWLDVKKAMRERGLSRFDYFHLNTISLLPASVLGERDSRFRQGNLLVCFRNVNQISVLEKETYRVLWAWGEGELEWPHHPTMLPNGHILIFDNGVRRKYSRVVELDPIAETIVWEYTAEQPGDFYSDSRGSAQHLPNGNVLICESNNGRVFEVTHGGEVVWTWLNPITRDGHREIVYRMMRPPSAWVDALLNRWWWWE